MSRSSVQIRSPAPPYLTDPLGVLRYRVRHRPLHLHNHACRAGHLRRSALPLRDWEKRRRIQPDSSEGRLLMKAWPTAGPTTGELRRLIVKRYRRQFSIMISTPATSAIRLVIWLRP